MEPERSMCYQRFAHSIVYLLRCSSLFKNQLFRALKSGNLQLITEISKWVFMEKGVLRVKSVSHHKVTFLSVFFL